MISKVSKVISNPIEIAVLGGASTVFSIAGNPRTTQPPDAEKKPELSLLTGQSSGFFCRFERNVHKPFSLLWVLISKRAGNPKGRQFLWPGVIQ